MEFDHNGKKYNLSAIAKVNEGELGLELILVEGSIVIQREYHSLGILTHCCPHCAIQLFNNEKKIAITINEFFSNISEGMIMVKLRDSCSTNLTVDMQLNLILETKILSMMTD